MVAQKKVDLNTPVDGTKKSTLEVSKLTPDLSEASLSLHGDYYRQMQSLMTKLILWDKNTISMLFLVLAGYNYYILSDYIEVSESITEFIQITKANKGLRVSLLFNSMVMLGFLGMVGIVSLLITDEFKVITDKLTNRKYLEYLYGFELTKFSKLDPESNNLKDKKLLSQGDNTQIMLYKEEPIACITIKPLLDKSNDSTLFIKVTGMDVRKAFRPLNFEPIMMNWVLERSAIMLKDYLKEKKIKHSKGCKATILVDNYTFNKDFAQFLTMNKFNKVDFDYNYNPTGEKTAILNGLVNRAFRSGRDTYAIHVVDNKNE